MLFWSRAIWNTGRLSIRSTPVTSTLRTLKPASPIASPAAAPTLAGTSIATAATATIAALNSPIVHRASRLALACSTGNLATSPLGTVTRDPLLARGRALPGDPRRTRALLTAF